MNVEVHINGNVVYSQSVGAEMLEVVINRLMEEYKIDLLKLVGLKAHIFITGVQSSMGDPEIILN